jgi:tRNA1Val (adenine37-N6)-methyltransferase
MSIFKFKFFDIKQSDAPMKVGTDAMVLGALVDVSNKQQGLDVGAGTGVLSLMCAQRNSQLNIDAIELDELASEECAFNFTESVFSERLTSIHLDFLKFETTKKYDLIISNPPFFQTRLENNDERKSNARHERSLPKSLFVTRVSVLLSQQGDFWIIVPYQDVEGWVEVAALNGLNLNSQTNMRGKQGGDYIRSVLRFSKIRSELVMDDFTVRCIDNDYTEEYVALTRDFHFKDLKK